MYDLPEIDQKLEDQYRTVKNFIENLADDHQLEVRLPEIDDLTFNGYRDLIDVVISAGCKILSFTFGIPDATSIQKLKNHHVTLIGTCTTVEESILLQNQVLISFVSKAQKQADTEEISYPKNQLKIAAFQYWKK